MTGPKQNPLAPVRRRGGPHTEPYEDAEVVRGQADAVLGALGRMQLRLDVLAREQGHALDQIVTALNRLTARLDALEATDPPRTAPHPTLDPRNQHG